MRSGSSNSLKQVSFQSLLSNHLTDLVDLDCPTNESPNLNVNLVGSCNGFVCMTIDNKYFLVWNPCTGKYKKFDADVNTKLCYNFSYGFGYDESNDDYKVVRIFYFIDSHYPLVKVYSLKRNSWKTIEDFNGNHVVCDWVKIANGRLHWFTCPLLMFGKSDIVSFDVKREVFGIVEQPNEGSGSFISRLGVLGGCLCVLCLDIDTKNMDLWVMKEYGVQESWAKIETLARIDGVVYEQKRPLSMLQNGEILFCTVGCFVIYNPKDNSFRLPMIRKWDFKGDPVIYVESLVSLVGYGG